MSADKKAAPAAPRFQERLKTQITRSTVILLTAFLILFGGLLVGGNTIQKLGLPVSTVQMIQGSILIFVAAGGMFTKYRIVRKERRLGND